MNLLRSKKGQGAVEYAMILVVVILVIVIGMRTGAFQNAVDAVNTFLTDTITTAAT